MARCLSATVDLPTGLETNSKGNKAAAEAMGIGKKADNAKDGKKTYQTYKKEPLDPSKDGVYSGRTSGK